MLCANIKIKKARIEDKVSSASIQTSAEIFMKYWSNALKLTKNV